MQKTIHILFSTILAFMMVVSCKEAKLPDPTTSPSVTDTDSTDTGGSDNGDSPVVASLPVKATPGYFNFPEFDLSEVTQEKVHISVFKAPVEVNAEENSIGNPQDMIWQWQGNPLPDLVRYEDGQLLKDEQPIPSRTLGCLIQEETISEYYWAAWGWDANGNYVQLVSPENKFVLEDTRKGSKYKGFKLLKDVGGDSLIDAGETITLEILLENTGDERNQEIQVTFQAEGVEDLPQTIRFGTLEVGSQVTQKLTFTTPYNIKSGDTLEIVMNITGEDCYNRQDTMHISINRPQVCVGKIVLNKYPPKKANGDDWDNCVFLRSTPDIYYEIYNPVNKKLLKKSIIKADAPLQNVDWNDRLCGIQTNQVYLLKFFDDDALNVCNLGGRDFIGQLEFSIKNTLDELPETLELENEKGNLKATLHLLRK